MARRSLPSASTSIVWFRLDLRLADNPALDAAVQRGGVVVPVFIWAPSEEAQWEPGAASRWWLRQSLGALEKALRKRGSRLIVRTGPTAETLRALVRETGATAVFWNRRHEPAVTTRDAKIRDSLRRAKIDVSLHNAALLHDPTAVRNQDGEPFQMFNPFWKHCLANLEPAAPLAIPRQIPAPKTWPESLVTEALKLEPTLAWTAGLRAAWVPGEAGAQDGLTRFLDQAATRYEEDRDHPGLPGTSRLSPHLHFGEIGPRQIWHASRRQAKAAGIDEPAWRKSKFLEELGWREFSHYVLHHNPTAPDTPLKTEFNRFPWRQDPSQVKRWQRGHTGYPLVDAGLRELWATGWMHNRVRMVVASFLVKDLMLAWTEGARWFWDTLVDADLAQNTFGWQWSAGCGVDAAPYFRVINPVSQSESFDPHGTYIRRWCPELARLPDEWLHEPSTAPAEVLTAAGVGIGQTYPAPMVDHDAARNAALEAFTRIQVRLLDRSSESRG